MASKHPPPPPEPKSLILPITGAVVVALLLVLVPTFSASGEEAEPEATEPEVVMVTLTVRSEPEGAAVKVNGEDQGTTPVDIEWEAGEEITLSLEKDGFETKTQSVTVDVGMEPIDIGLEPSALVLIIEGADDATVEIDGEAVEDASRIELEALPESPMAITVRKRGFEDFTAQVQASNFEASDEGRLARVQVELTPRRRTSAPRPAPAAAPPEPEPQDHAPSNPF